MRLRLLLLKQIVGGRIASVVVKEAELLLRVGLQEANVRSCLSGPVRSPCQLRVPLFLKA